MPICKNCGSRISKFDKDICPICGEKNPINGLLNDTDDVTSQIQLHPELTMKAKKRSTIFFLSLFLGFSGAPFFYLGYKKYAVMEIIAQLLVLGLLFAILYFLVKSSLLLSILISLSTILINNLCQAFIFLFKHGYKDSNGELVL